MVTFVLAFCHVEAMEKIDVDKCGDLESVVDSLKPGVWREFVEQVQKADNCKYADAVSSAVEEARRLTKWSSITGSELTQKLSDYVKPSQNDLKNRQFGEVLRRYAWITRKIKVDGYKQSLGLVANPKYLGGCKGFIERRVLNDYNAVPLANALRMTRILNKNGSELIQALGDYIEPSQDDTRNRLFGEVLREYVSFVSRQNAIRVGTEIPVADAPPPLE
jgi:hypothetical protein